MAVTPETGLSLCKVGFFGRMALAACLLYTSLDLIELFQTFFAIVCHRDLITFLGQVQPQQLADIGIVGQDGYKRQRPMRWCTQV